MKRSAAMPKRVGSGKTKPSEMRDLAGDFGEGFRSDTRLSKVLSAGKSARNPSVTSKPRSAHRDPRVMKYAEVLAHAVEIFGSRVRANAWLNRPNRIFKNQSPIQILTQDPEAVEEELIRIDEGIYY